jgi:DNA-binding response OmpR family regulator
MAEVTCGRATHVLVVEDDDSLRFAMVRCLTKEGFQVTQAATGADAVEMARTLRPDAAVIDVVLPDAGGLGIARAIRREQDLAALPVLFTTALSLPSVREALSPAPVLFKPFTRRQLVKLVREVTRAA